MNLKQIQKIIKEKVDGVWIADHDEHGHHYKNTRTGKRVDSVTTQNVLDKPHLVPWAAEVGIRHFLEKNLEFYDPKNIDQTNQQIKESKFAYTGIRDSAGGIGTQAHKVIEKFFIKWIETGKKPDSMNEFLDGNMDAKVWAAARSIEKLLDSIKEKIVPVVTELLVGSEKIDGAGTLDFLLLIDGKLWIWDWKTSNQTDKSYAVQVAAYKAMFEEMTELEVYGLSIVLLSKDYDKVTLYDVPYMNRAYSVFKHQNAIYKWINNGQKKLIERKNRIKI